VGRSRKTSKKPGGLKNDVAVHSPGLLCVLCIPQLELNSSETSLDSCRRALTEACPLSPEERKRHPRKTKILHDNCTLSVKHCVRIYDPKLITAAKAKWKPILTPFLVYNEVPQPYCWTSIRKDLVGKKIGLSSTLGSNKAIQPPWETILEYPLLSHVGNKTSLPLLAGLGSMELFCQTFHYCPTVTSSHSLTSILHGVGRGGYFHPS
jgi:hypothetical protein